MYSQAELGCHVKCTLVCECMCYIILASEFGHTLP